MRVEILFSRTIVLQSYNLGNLFGNLLARWILLLVFYCVCGDVVYAANTCASFL